VTHQNNRNSRKLTDFLSMSNVLSHLNAYTNLERHPVASNAEHRLFLVISFPMIKTTMQTKTKMLLLKLLLGQMLFLCCIQVTAGLVSGAGRRRRISQSSTPTTRSAYPATSVGNLIGEMLAQSVVASASTTRTIPFPLPVPRSSRSPIFREHQKKLVSLLAMGLTEMLAPNAATLDLSSRTLTSTVALPKLINLSNEELAEIIKTDCRERQFLYTADMTRAIYDDRATFKDGSDLDGSYPMDAWIRGCQLLFDAKQSRCKILEHTMIVTQQHVSFRFAETLTFRTVLQPRVYLTGTVLMKRDNDTGLIVSYEEKWDQNMNEIVRRTKLTI
jgi:hypothetical protein